jgi:hypothetical protein
MSAIRRAGFLLTSAVALAATFSAPAQAAPGDPTAAGATRADALTGGPVSLAGGQTAADGAVADKVRPLMNGARMGRGIDAYRASCARAVVAAVRSRGLSRRAAVIAVTTAITETTLHNYDEAGDHDSLGLFQQRPSQGWGTPAQLVDPVYATNAFVNAMLRKYPNNAWLSGGIGAICQKVQVSAAPDAYDREAHDAGLLVDELWDDAGPVAAGSDTNGDGHGDVLIATNSPTGGGELWRFGGTGNTTLYTQKAIIENSGALAGSKLAVTDVDGDGDADAILAHGNAKSQTELYIWKGNGDGTFTPNWTPAGVLGRPLSGVEIAAGDTDGHGQGDVLIATNSPTGAGELWRFSGTTDGRLNTQKAIIENSGALAGSKLAVTDVDGDGDADVVLAHGNASDQTELFIWKGQDDGTLTPNWTAVGLLGRPLAGSDIN